jgi:hypothetical protein
MVLLKLDYSFSKIFCYRVICFNNRFYFARFSLCAEIRSGNQISRSRADREGAAHPAESETVTKTRLIQVAKTDVVIIIKIRKSGENRNKIENEETGMLCAVRKPGLRRNRFTTDNESIKGRATRIGTQGYFNPFG